MTGLADHLFRAACADEGALLSLAESSWPELALRAAEEGIEGLLYQRCTAAGIRLPEEQSASMGRCYHLTAAQNYAALRELGSLLDDMDGAGVDALLMPGACLLPLYPDVGCRVMDDIDLLVPAASARKAKELLLARGYVQPPRYSDLFAGDRLVVDLHTDLLNCGRIRARRGSGWLDPREVWRDRRTVVVEDVKVQAMGLEDALLYTAVHGLKHSFRRLNWLLDLHLLLHTALDWDLLEEKAGRGHLLRPLVYGFTCLAHAQRQALPERAVDQLRSTKLGGFEQWLLRRMCAARPHCDWGEALRAFNTRGRIQGAAFLLEYLFPRPAVLLQVFPSLPKSLFPLAYGLRLGQICLRGGRLLLWS